MTDHNCFIGSWPFYSLDGSFSSLCREHGQSGIKTGYISSIESIFFNDFYESEQKLADAIKGSGYRHTVIPNPTVQGFEQTLLRCFEEFDVKGIRLVPGYHGYSLADDCVNPIIDLAREKKIPIFVNARLTDERMTHMIHPTLPSAGELADFVSLASGVKVVLCYLKEHEANAVWQTCKSGSNIFFDVSGMSGSLFQNELAEWMSRCVLGSGFPLRTVSSAVMRLEKELCDEVIKRNILYAAI